MTTVRAPRRIDRQRRQRIIDATLDVIVEHGVEGTTHRLVAAQAGVPLSATSYYFGTIESLLIAAMMDTITRDLQLIKTRFESLPTDADMVKEISDAILGLLADGRRSAILATEFYAAALRREELRELAVEWEDSWTDVLEPLIGTIRAQTVGLVSAAIVQKSMVREETPSPEVVAAIIRHVISGAPG